MSFPATWQPPSGSAPPGGGGARGAVRVTELSPTCLRVELTPAGNAFTEAATLMVPVRLQGRPLEAGEEGAARRVWRSSSGEVEVAVEIGGARPPGPGDVEVRWRHGGEAGSFRADDSDPTNFRGTVRSLDVVGGHNLPALPPSLLSRRGAVVIEDRSALLDPGDGFPRPRPVENGVHDLYVFAYGRDHRTALRDWIALTGRPALIPRYCFGLWWSRYHPHTQSEFLAIVDRFAAEGMPLDVLVVDVDWHLHGWEGYDFDPRCFPDPPAFFAALRERGVHTTFNVHPRGAIQPEDSHYAECVQRLPPGRVEPGAGVGLDLARAAEAQIGADMRRPLEDMGVAFWWTDGNHAHLAGLDPQMATNHAFHVAAAQRRDRRPVVFSRYGGHGSQRHGIGFSADTQSHWEVLAYLVDFTATAADEAFGTWSHDVGGFFGRRLDGELLRRWMQAALLWPVLRLHSDTFGERLPWEYDGDVLEAARTVATLRRRLVPALYSLAHELHRTGMAPYRPMHLAFPDWDGAAEVRGQAMLGDALLTAPVVEPAREPGGVSVRRVVLPPGEWHELDASLHGGRRLRGPAVLDLRVGPQEMPLYGRAGGIVVEQDAARRGVDGPPDPLMVTVFHGADGSFVHYDDDGITRAHEQGAVALTPIVYDNAGATVRLGPVEGDRSMLPEVRRVVVRLVGVDGAPGGPPGGREVSASFNWNLAGGSISIGFHVAGVDPAREAQLDMAARIRDAVRAAEEQGAVIQARLDGATTPAGAAERIHGAPVTEPARSEALMALTRAAVHVLVEHRDGRLTPVVTVAQPDIPGYIAVAGRPDAVDLAPGRNHDLRHHSWPVSLRLLHDGKTVAEVGRTLTQDLTYLRLLSVRNAGGEWQHLGATLAPHPLDEPQARIDLEPFAGAPIEVAAALRSERDQEVVLRCTEKLGLQLQVNGEEVALHAEQHRNHRDRRAATVHLRAGDNTILLRCDAPAYDHFMAVQVSAPHGVEVVRP
ncbi:MAG TPA: TIM-barrel domain-containing protein [Candidatus Angelobacter sp.]|jgi:hypothetical protein|nr:TIM-barrel domain-containing protein [Candidatus Angelobacter sp.]